MSYQLELKTGMAAVRAAANVCRAVQANLVIADTLEKKDKSPVTVADFAAQAIVCAHLLKDLPNDLMVGEEDSAELRTGEEAGLRAAVVQHVADELGGADEEQVLGWIDHGCHDGSAARYWTLDPIDGTKGFLRGEQYAIALGLIENGEVVAGVLGCPNLMVGDHQGALFTATKDGGATMYRLFDETDQGQSIQVAQIASASEARFCESVESGHSNQGESAQIAAILGITGEPYRIDSQCKYAAVARNDASIYLRLPTSETYREKIWDHAAGKLIVEAAGGKVTDVNGNALDFTQGCHLDNNKGVVATCGVIHDDVINAIRQVRG